MKGRLWIAPVGTEAPTLAELEQAPWVEVNIEGSALHWPDEEPESAPESV